MMKLMLLLFIGASVISDALARPAESDPDFVPGKPQPPAPLNFACEKSAASAGVEATCRWKSVPASAIAATDEVIGYTVRYWLVGSESATENEVDFPPGATEGSVTYPAALPENAVLALQIRLYTTDYEGALSAVVRVPLA